MKKTIPFLFFLFYAFQSSAMNLWCAVDRKWPIDGIEHPGIFSSYELTCYDRKGDSFSNGIMRYYGPGFMLGASDAVHLQCPLVSEKKVRARLDQGKSWTIIGPKVELGVALIGDFGVQLNQRGAVCFMEADEVGIGAVAGINTIVLRK